MNKIEEILKESQRARLIPSIADSKKEERLVSVLLATLSVVPPFAKQFLERCGVGKKRGKTSKLLCHTEVKFPTSDESNHDNSQDRPDGVLTLSTGKSPRWRALLECKIDNVEIDREQVLKYAEIAHQYGIEAVITLSNQLTPLPTHIPYSSIPKKLSNHVDFFHISWVSVLTQALLILKDKEEISIEQTFILEEMTYYFEPPKSGVKRFDQMNKEWKPLVEGIRNGKKFNPSSPEIENTISSWHQEERDVCLLLSRRIGKHVDIPLPQKYKKYPELRLQEACNSLVTSHELRSSFRVPNAASDIDVIVNLERRTIACSMKLDAPGGNKRDKSRINWLLKQLQDVDGDDVSVRAVESGRGKNQKKQELLSKVRSNTSCLEMGRQRATIATFEVVVVKSLAGRFSKPRNFIEDLENLVPEFYNRIGQRLKNWAPSAPQIDKHDPIQEPTIRETTEENSRHDSPPTETSQSHNMNAPNDTNTLPTESP